MPAGLSTAIHSSLSRMIGNSGKSSTTAMRSSASTSRDAIDTARSLTSTRRAAINSRAFRREIPGFRAAMA